MHPGRREYMRTHWGHEGGPDVRLLVADTDHGSIVALGNWERGVAYTCDKGDGPTRYVHDWGEGSKAKLVLPVLCYHHCDRPRCASRGKLIIAGGSYRVTERGIVG